MAGCAAMTVDHAHQAKQVGHRLDLCKDLLAKRQLEMAKNECDKALALDPKNDEAYVARGLVALLHAADTERTLEIDQCLTGVDAEATHQDLDKQLKDADADFAHATDIHPDYGEAWANRGVVHNLLADYQTAADELETALSNPMRLSQPGLTRANRGWALFHEKNYVDAARELRQALQFQPKMCVANYRLGRVYFAREEWDKAADLFQTVSDDPSCGSQEASLYLMKTRLAQGLVDDARSARDACLRMSPKSCVAASCIADGSMLGAIAVGPRHPVPDPALARQQGTP
jgi:tetratricopeptide (TPR) repeat protein